MKKFMMLAACLCGGLLLSGCKNDDLEKRVDDLEKRVEQLEEFCRRMNANIASLQSIVDVLSEADRITAVVPVRSGSETILYDCFREERTDDDISWKECRGACHWYSAG